jgi:hypothetical protein
MSFSFQAGPLPGTQTAEVLPLVQATWPGTDLAAWERYVQFFGGKSAAESGVLAMRDSGDCLCGLLVYSLHWSLGLGPVLTIPLFTAVDMANSLKAVRALLEAAETLASALHCAALEIRLDRAQSRLADRLRLLGLSSDAGLLCKMIPR